mmetsp:Transcript_77879/g.152871  ORF Transcript_77879/g.152871 Transcript_77879/m.152871 type:complete len:231 (+) Transcript_77879:48-740(+)
MLRVSTSLPSLALATPATRASSPWTSEFPITPTKTKQATGSFEYQRRFEDAYESVARQRNLARLDALFRATDIDGSGDITLGEFQETLRKGPIQSIFATLGIQPHQATAVFKAFDTNCDAMLSHQEFIEGLMKLVGPDLEGCASDLDARMLRAANFGKQAATLSEPPNSPKPVFVAGGGCGAVGGRLLPEVSPLCPVRMRRAFVLSARSQALHPASAAPRGIRKAHLALH